MAAFPRSPASGAREEEEPYQPTDNANTEESHKHRIEAIGVADGPVHVTAERVELETHLALRVASDAFAT